VGTNIEWGLTTTGTTGTAWCTSSRCSLFSSRCFRGFLLRCGSECELARCFRCSLRINEVLVDGRIHLDRMAHDVFPVSVLDWVQTFILGARTRGQHFIKLQLGCQFIRTAMLLVLATSHVIPWEGRCQVSLLTRAEFLQVIWGRHAGCVEEVLVLTDTVGTRRSGLALWCNAVDGDLGLVHRDWLKATNLGGELVHDVHVRVQAQVAGCTNHEVGALLTVQFSQFIQAVIDWAVFWVGPLAPQHQVAIREGEVAATLVAPLTSAHCAGFILGLTGVTTRRGCCIVPVGGGNVVAIGTVFCLQLPVAVLAVGGRTAQYFQALRGLVNEHVQDGTGVTQVLIEFHDIWVQRTKAEAAVAFKAWDATQVMAAIGAEVFWVSAIFLVLDLKQSTVIGEGPAVERTSDGGAVVRLT